MPPKRLLLVFAHPDDETFATGITIVKYRELDADIQLICATRGQAGKPGDPPICSITELPIVREQELRTAASLLGISQVHLLDYEDKHLSEVPIEQLVSQIVSVIQEQKPHVVITFALHGISGHPDHQAISAATDTAVMTLAPERNPVKKLYHVTRSSASPTPAGRTTYSDSPEDITTEILSQQSTSIVGQALRAHRTQHVSVERVFPGVVKGDFSRVPAVNHFILKWNNLPHYHIAGKETDLFAGISE
jgi:LmbE family N-acetylglucosaminyl deacetylase